MSYLYYDSAVHEVDWTVKSIGFTLPCLMNCGSRNTMYSVKSDSWVCLDCGERFLPEPEE